MNRRTVFALLILVASLGLTSLPAAADDKTEFEDFESLLVGFSKAEKIEAWEAFLQKYPDNKYIPRVKEILAQLRGNAPAAPAEPAGDAGEIEDPELDFLTDDAPAPAAEEPTAAEDDEAFDALFGDAEPAPEEPALPGDEDAAAPASPSSAPATAQDDTGANDEFDPFRTDPEQARQEAAQEAKRAEREKRRAERQAEREKRRAERKKAREARKAEREQRKAQRLAQRERQSDEVAESRASAVTPDNLGTSESQATLRVPGNFQVEVSPSAMLSMGSSYMQQPQVGGQVGVHVGRYLVLEGEAAAFTARETDLLGTLREIGAEPEVISKPNFRVGGGVAVKAITGQQSALGQPLSHDLFVRLGGGLLHTDLEICRAEEGASCDEPLFIDGGMFTYASAGVGHRYRVLDWLALRSDLRYRVVLERIDDVTTPRNSLELGLGASVIF